MKTLAALIILAASLQPVVRGDAAAAAAASGGSGKAAAVAAASGRPGNAAAVAAASGGSGKAAAVAASGRPGNAAAVAAASGGSGAVAVATSNNRDPINSDNIQCVCTADYRPVCGTDRNTYSNKCSLNCISEHNKRVGLPEIEIWKKGECPQPVCKCGDVFEPICGSNNHTYSNECYLKCENKMRYDAKLALIDRAYSGKCKKPACICPERVNPVCGSDGKTYRNVCVLQCYSRLNMENRSNPITVSESGACKNERCVCTKNYAPVCASDNVTYSNMCVFECQNRRINQLGQKSLTIQYERKCIDCVCQTVYAPVCASDGKTYPNYCLFDCENKKRVLRCESPLEIVCHRECCDNRYKPICASDNRTYINRCRFYCENERRDMQHLPLLEMNHYGRCVCKCDGCPPKKDEVCGTDGRTYWNICWLGCASRCSVNAGLDPIYPDRNGPCPSI